MYPEYQSKVIKEIDEIVGNRDVQLEDLPKLTYLYMCIKESLRLFPIAPFIMRVASEKFVIGN